ncbi:MAG: hypothetical protein WC536_01020 [Patescibacteria group bacterium]
MIDTIAITLKPNEFWITDNTKFIPISSNNGFDKLAYNGSRKSDVYLPRLTPYKRGGSKLFLKIEFSAPKMLFGNNFDELNETDFDSLVKILAERLKIMGIGVFPSFLRTADVSKIDFSKNIALSNYWKSTMILNELKKIDLTKRLDIQQNSFRNFGYILHFHCNSFEIAIYDKIKDMEQSKISEKRAFEKESAIQLNLFDEIKKKQRPMEVLRFEIRLVKRAKIKQLFKTLNITNDLTLENMFSKKLSQQVLNHYWEEITSNMQLALIKDSDDFTVLEKILESRKFRPITALALAMSVRVIKEEGADRFKRLLEKASSGKTFTKLKKDILSLNLPKNVKAQGFEQVSNQLSSFEMLKISEYLDGT